MDEHIGLTQAVAAKILAKSTLGQLLHDADTRAGRHVTAEWEAEGRCNGAFTHDIVSASILPLSGCALFRHSAAPAQPPLALSVAALIDGVATDCIPRR